MILIIILIINLLMTNLIKETMFKEITDLEQIIYFKQELDNSNNDARKRFVC